MATAYAQILDSIPDMIGILMIGTAFYLVRRQRLSQFVDVRKLLLLVDAFFGIVLFSYMGYLLFAILYLIFDAPYTISNLSTIGGVPVIGLEYNQDAEIVSIIILVIFVAYP